MNKSIGKAKVAVCVSLVFFSISCSFFDQWIEKIRKSEEPKDFSPKINKENTSFYTCIPIPRDPEYGIVAKVIDGDSIVVRMNDAEYDVRYIGIDAPEFDEKTFDEALASMRANQDLVEGEEVMLFRDVSDTDRYGRLLRYVFLDDLFINLELVERGYALPKNYPPDIACQQVLNAAGSDSR